MLKHFSLIVSLLCLTLPSSGLLAADRPFAVIIAPGTTDHRLTRETVSMIFKRKQNYWESGMRIQPINLPPANALRQSFSQVVLGQVPEAMEDYWREMYFHGVLPPHVVASEEAVILFVGATPGAIGYISACPIERKLNIVLLVGDVPGCSR
jgi:ABC-type phosphate transport system substrate-binding protein